MEKKHKIITKKHLKNAQSNKTDSCKKTKKQMKNHAKLFQEWKAS